MLRNNLTYDFMTRISSLAETKWKNWIVYVKKNGSFKTMANEDISDMFTEPLEGALTYLKACGVSLLADKHLLDMM